MSLRRSLRRAIDAGAGWPSLLAWLALIFALSSIPATPQPPAAVPYDKFAHFALYGVLGFIVAWMLRKRPGRALALDIAIAVALCCIYGASDEYHQSFVRGRDTSLADLGADVAGALAGAAAAALLSAALAAPRRR